MPGLDDLQEQLQQSPLGYFFSGQQPLSDATLARRAAITQALAARRGGRPFPKTLGEGIASMGESVGDTLEERRLMAAENLQQKATDAAMQKLRPQAAPGAPPAQAAPPAVPQPPTPPTAAAQPAQPQGFALNGAPSGGAQPGGDMLDPTPVLQQRARIAAAIAQQQGAAQQAQATPEVAQPNPTEPGEQPPEQASAGFPGTGETTSPDQPVRLAARDTGIMSDAPPIGAGPRAMPVEPDNPPTPTDIQPAPTQFAQRAPAVNDISPAPAGAPRAGAVPSATPQMKAYEVPEPTAPTPPPPARMEQREIDARNLAVSGLNNPRARVLAGQVIQEEEAKRGIIDAQNRAKYEADVRQHELDKTARREYLINNQTRTYDLNQKAAEDVQRSTSGTLVPAEQAHLTRTQEAANGAVATINALQNGRLAIEAGTVFGLTAPLQLQYYRAKAALGDQRAQKIVEATQNFPANLGAMVAQQTRLFGGSQLTEQERKYGQVMSGADISLDQGSALRLLEIGEKAARGTIAYHQRQMDDLLANQPPRLRTLYGLQEILPPTPMQGRLDAPANAPAAAPGQPIVVQSEAEANKLPPGTRVILNGKRFKVQ